MSLAPSDRGNTVHAAAADARAERLKFSGDNAFHRELRLRVEAEFRRAASVR